jgi:hypothetical protein
MGKVRPVAVPAAWVGVLLHHDPIEPAAKPEQQNLTVATRLSIHCGQSTFESKAVRNGLQDRYFAKMRPARFVTDRDALIDAKTA